MMIEMALGIVVLYGLVHLAVYLGTRGALNAYFDNNTVVVVREEDE